MRELEEIVAAQGARIQDMEGEIEQRMKLALIQMTQARGTEDPAALVTFHNNVVVTLPRSFRQLNQNRPVTLWMKYLSAPLASFIQH